MFSIGTPQSNSCARLAFFRSIKYFCRSSSNRLKAGLNSSATSIPTSKFFHRYKYLHRQNSFRVLSQTLLAFLKCLRGDLSDCTAPTSMYCTYCLFDRIINQNWCTIGYCYTQKNTFLFETNASYP
jgi:hypothetical protein